jgi:hypothetical protein
MYPQLCATTTKYLFLQGEENFSTQKHHIPKQWFAQHTSGPQSTTLHYDAYTLPIARAHALPYCFLFSRR